MEVVYFFAICGTHSLIAATRLNMFLITCVRELSFCKESYSFVKESKEAPLLVPILINLVMLEQDSVCSPLPLLCPHEHVLSNYFLVNTVS